MLLKKLQPGQTIHLMGICGTAMGGLAGLLHQKGFRVTGSDRNIYPPMSTQLRELGIEVMEGYKPQNLHHNPDLIVVGNVIPEHFPEAREMVAREIPYTSLPKAIGEFVISRRNSIVVTGTHGKTTTSSMIAWISEVCGKQAGYLIGGLPENFEHSFRAPTKKNDASSWFITEGDEYDTAYFDKVPKFIHYKPKYVTLSSVEFDHADIYRDLEHVKEAFLQASCALFRKRDFWFTMLMTKSSANLSGRARLGGKARKVSYGLHAGDYRITNREVVRDRNQFSVALHGRSVADMTMQSFGLHNTMNALSGFVLAKELDWPVDKILQALTTFKGVKRRQSYLGEKNGVILIEDFAHHPTAVDLTLKSMRERYRGQRVVAVFEPRSATSRRRVFQKEYVEALEQADYVIVSEPYDQSKIDEADRFSVEELITELRKRGVKAHFFTHIGDIVKEIRSKTQPGDVVVLMSNGGFGGIYEELLQD